MELLWLILPLLVPLLMLPVWLLAHQSEKAAKHQATRLALIERKLQLVMDHLGAVEPEPDMPEVVRALDQGNKIAAVKEYRVATGADLREAKTAVDAMAEQRGL